MEPEIDVSKFIYPTSAGDPKHQSYYVFDSNAWRPRQPASRPEGGQSELNERHFSTLRLLSWNIDVLIPFAKPRMASALNYLSSVVSNIQSEPVVIFLQEMSETDLLQIQEAPWIRERFYITDVDTGNWISDFYGTTTLVDRRLSILNVFRVPFESKFQRDGFFVDVRLSGTTKVLRLCNVHLESLVADPPLRPKQLALAAKYMHEDCVHAAVLAGDCNSIQPFDRTIHSDNGLKDGYLWLGGEEDSDEGYTWGYQVPEEQFKRFGPSRMDKVMFCGGVRVKGLERIGVGVKVEDEETRKEMMKRGMVDFVTDHYGLNAELEIEGASLKTSD